MTKVFSLTGFASVLSPTMAPFSTLQNVGSPSQFFMLMPSKIGVKPVRSSNGIGCGPRPPPPPRRPSPRPGRLVACSGRRLPAAWAARPPRGRPMSTASAASRSCRVSSSERRAVRHNRSRSPKPDPPSPDAPEPPSCLRLHRLPLPRLRRLQHRVGHVIGRQPVAEGRRDGLPSPTPCTKSAN